MSSKRLSSIDYQLGQINALTTHIADSPPQPDRMGETILALQLICRLWSQFATDRPMLNLSQNLLSVENDVARPAFLDGILWLCKATSEPTWRPLRAAVKTLKKITAPAPTELIDTIVERCHEDLATLEQIFGDLAPPSDVHPVDHLSAIAQRHAQIDLFDDDYHVQEPCWAYNLLFGTRADILGMAPLPFPALMQRSSFRRDLDQSARTDAVRSQIVLASSQLLSDIYCSRRFSQSYSDSFCRTRSDSRLPNAWTLLAGTKKLTVRHLQLAIGGSEIGARRLLETLVRNDFAHHASPWFELKKSYRRSSRDPRWTRLPVHDI